jgi:Kef-type K+ transport system membrane component KefB
VVILIAFGAIVGPAGLGLLARGETIVLLGTLGLLHLLFQVGLELDLRGFVRHRQRSLLFGGLSFALPLALALVTFSLLGLSTAAILLLGAVVASHTLLAYPVAARLGITRDPAVTAAVGGTLITDTLSLTLLALVSGLLVEGAGAWALFRLVALLALAVATTLLLLPRLARSFLRRTDGEASVRYLFMLSAMLVSAAIAEAAGAAPIIGAFLAGLALNRSVPNTSTVMARVRFVGDAVFIPFFLLSVGMLVDVRVLASLETLAWAGLLTAMVLIGKGGAALLSGRLLGFDRRQGWLMVGLTIPQAAATLAVTFVGLELGLFGPVLVNAVIAMILVTSLLGATLVERAGRAWVLARPAREGEGEVAHRMLVPVANPSTAEALLDLAFMLRSEGSDETVYPLSVVLDEGNVEARVAAAERVLAHALVYTTEAEVPTTPLTRVAVNPAVGIVQAAREQRITDIVLGWQGHTSARAASYGSVIDQVIEHSDAQVWIYRIDRPLRPRGTAYLILPPAVDYHPGFYSAIATTKRLLQALATPVVGLVVKGDPERIAARIAEVPSPVEMGFESLSDWPELIRTLTERAGADDLVMLIGARQGTVAWSPALDRVPGMLVGLEASFLGVVPAAGDELASDVAVDRRGGIAALLRLEAISLDLEGDLDEVLAQLLSTLIPAQHADATAVLRALVEDEVGFANEVLPGALVAHARSTALSAPRLAIGIHRHGLRHPRATAPLHLIAVLVSPDDGPMQPHLARLARVVQRIRREAGAGLVGVESAEALRALLTRRSNDR